MIIIPGGLFCNNHMIFTIEKLQVSKSHLLTSWLEKNCIKKTKFGLHVYNSNWHTYQLTGNYRVFLINADVYRCFGAKWLVLLILITAYFDSFNLFDSVACAEHFGVEVQLISVKKRERKGYVCFLTFWRVKKSDNLKKKTKNKTISLPMLFQTLVKRLLTTVLQQVPSKDNNG